MNHCIYCDNDGTTTTFKGREHVIPELLGTFDNNLTLIGCVCDKCNTNIFGPLETRFKEDTEEGVSFQMINFANSHQVRIRSKNFKISTELGLGDVFFDETFPFLKFNGDKWQITFVPQIKVRGYAGDGYLILLIENIKKLSRGRGKFTKLKNILKGVESKNVSIFTYGGDDPKNQELNEAIELVRELGVPYKPGTQKFLPPSDPTKPTKPVVVSIEGRIDSDTVRILAKIAFNYFAHCAVKSGCETILHHQNFAKIKSYILGTLALPLNEVIIQEPSYKGIMADEKGTNSRRIGHIITLDNERGNIIANVSFVGRLIYTISLGQAPAELNRADFGNGHIFDPFGKKIWGMTKNEARRGSDEKISFSLFNGF